MRVLRDLARFEKKRILEVAFVIGIHRGQLFVERVLDRVGRPLFAGIVLGGRQVLVIAELAVGCDRRLALGVHGRLALGNVELGLAYVGLPTLVVGFARLGGVAARLLVGDLHADVHVEVLGRRIVERRRVLGLGERVVADLVSAVGLVVVPIERRQLRQPIVDLGFHASLTIVASGSTMIPPAW